ncbi:MAG: SpoVG family protein [bacterium]
MEITEINISLRNEDKLKAFVNVTFDDQFVVRGMKIIKGSNGYFISMPSRRMPDGSYRDIAHPIRNSFRDYLEKQILDKYQNSLKQEGGELSQNVSSPVEER